MNLKLYWENIFEYFEEEGWPLYEMDNENNTAVTYVRGDNATFRVFVWLDGESRVLNLGWYYPSNIHVKKRHSILDLLNRLN